MPESLNTRKKLLKTLQLTDYATLIEDINYNFGVLMSSPLFIGLQGDPGTDGTQGPAGIRGSKWMFASLDAFREQYFLSRNRQDRHVQGCGQFHGRIQYRNVCGPVHPVHGHGGIVLFQDTHHTDSVRTEKRMHACQI